MIYLKIWLQQQMIYLEIWYSNKSWKLKLMSLENISSNKAVGVHNIPVELFTKWQDDTIKMLGLVYKKGWKTKPLPRSWKRYIIIPKLKQWWKSCRTWLLELFPNLANHLNNSSTTHYVSKREDRQRPKNGGSVTYQLTIQFPLPKNELKYFFFLQPLNMFSPFLKLNIILQAFPIW